MAARMRAAACIGAAGALLLCPVAAQAKTKTVALGLPKAAQKSFQKTGADVNDFFPHGVTVHVGDRVKFVSTGNFHNLDLPKKGGARTPLIAPTSQTATGVTDAAGSPFWFNGRPLLAFDPALLRSGFGKKFTYRGTKSVQSGLPLAGNPKPITVKFAKAGKYTYFCDVHPGMTGVVRVVAKRRRVPSARADRKALKAQIKRDLRSAKKLASAKTPANTVDVGSADRHGVEYYGMVPGNLTVARGTVLRFRMSPASYEDHTATFGTDNPETPNPSGYLAALAKTFEGPGPFDARATYPSDPPGTLASLSPTTHGNGFWNSGVMQNRASVLPSSGQVRFDTPGTYNYYCLIHPFMHGVITVQ